MRALEGVGTAALFILMVVVFVDVVGRNLLNRPLPWGTELLSLETKSPSLTTYLNLSSNCSPLLCLYLTTPLSSSACVNTEPTPSTRPPAVKTPNWVAVVTRYWRCSLVLSLSW